ncbi:MAG: redoxin domain-containing protein [Bacteroidales bacterium]|nr:redoxin domain-containing protein [Bacteroidales bacterium]
MNKATLIKSSAVVLMLIAVLSLPSCKRTPKKTVDEAATTESVEDLDAQYAKDLLAKGTPAPDFTLQTLDGKELSLKDFRGKYVVLDFWASWCPDCRKDAPEVKSLWEKYGSDKVAFVGVSFDTDKEKWGDYVKENGLGWIHVSPLAKWKETQVSQDYKVNWIPSMYLIDPDGNVVFGTVMIDKLAKELASIAGK